MESRFGDGGVDRCLIASSDLVVTLPTCLRAHDVARCGTGDERSQTHMFSFVWWRRLELELFVLVGVLVLLTAVGLGEGIDRLDLVARQRDT